MFAKEISTEAISRFGDIAFYFQSVPFFFFYYSVSVHDVCDSLVQNALHFDYWDFAKNKPELVKNLASAAHQSDVALIFHCMNSKTRGPQCAMTIATCLVENFPAYKCKVYEILSLIQLNQFY
jgi:hypothetical protein